MSLVSSKCCNWSSPTGTWVALQEKERRKETGASSTGKNTVRTCMINEVNFMPEIWAVFYGIQSGFSHR